MLKTRIRIRNISAWDPQKYTIRIQESKCQKKHLLLSKSKSELLQQNIIKNCLIAVGFIKFRHKNKRKKRKNKLKILLLFQKIGKSKRNVNDLEYKKFQIAELL